MKPVVIRLVGLALVLSACTGTGAPEPAVPGTSGRAPSPVASPPASAAAAPDTLQSHRDRAVASVLERIAGRENEPAGEVFENVELLGRIPAGRLVRIMDIGFARSLGVACDHCHVRGDWASDEKREKGVAREMWRLVGRLNGELLPAIEGIGERPTVNCTTCHRGQVEPATSLP
jgi:hypothetical protein